MFERFTDEARTAVTVAQEEARELRGARIEPVHLLLALTRAPGGGGHVLRGAGADHAAVRAALARAGGPLDAEALASVGVDLEQVRAAAEAMFGPGALDRGRPERSGHIPFAEGSKQALAQSLRHVLRQPGRRRDRAIDSAAVLAGLLTVGDPVVDRVLRQLGADPGGLRHRASGSDAA